MVKEKQDVIIVGAGAAGLMLAARLAEGGQSVTILEAGAERQLSDLISSQIWARKLKWAEPAVSESGDHKIGHAFNAGSGTGGSERIRRDRRLKENMTGQVARKDMAGHAARVADPERAAGAARGAGVGDDEPRHRPDASPLFLIKGKPPTSSYVRRSRDPAPRQD